MQPAWRQLLPFLLAAACLAAAPATQPTTRPVSSQPADDGQDPEEPWDDPSVSSVLTTAAAVRALTPEQAAVRRPVKIRGTLTYAAMLPPIVFVRDATGGVCVVGQRDRESRLVRIGSVVEFEGVTDIGGRVPHVVAGGRNEQVKLLVVDPGRPPVPLPATIGQLGTAALHGEFVDVEGVVRSVRSESLGVLGPAALVVTLAQGSDRAEAVLFHRGPEPLAPEQLVGAVVRARGVFNAAASGGQDPTAMRLLLRTARDVRVRRPTVPAREMPIMAIGAASPEGAAESASARTRVQGVVTLAVPGKGMFVQDNSGGVWVEPVPANLQSSASAPSAPEPGDRIDVVGFPGRRGWSSVLSDASWQVVGHTPLPAAPLLTAGQALDRATDARLVRLEAMVLSVSRPAGETTLVLQSGEGVFLARLAGAGGGAPPANVSDGSWVRVTGVCMHSQADAAAGWAPGSTPAASAGPAPPGSFPTSFHLLLASPELVQVISAPGWWTLRNVLYVCAALAAAALAAFVWVVALRRRVARQTGQIREHLAKRTLYEERVRIARDLHDSLEQDLLGITMQLNATEKLLARPEQAKQSLQLAAAMVRRSQAETHRAVWDLRERRPGQEGLVAALREAVAGLSTWRGGNGAAAEGAEGPRVEVHVSGAAHELPPQVENHLLRVALEAVTNALKHAGAKEIDVDLSFDADAVALRVSDDGRGFDAERLPPPSSGHFGLFGMRERAEKLGARLTIRSGVGQGTQVRLDVPLGDPAVAPQAAVTGAAAE